MTLEYNCTPSLETFSSKASRTGAWLTPYFIAHPRFPCKVTSIHLLMPNELFPEGCGTQCCRLTKHCMHMIDPPQDRWQVHNYTCTWGKMMSRLCLWLTPIWNHVRQVYNLITGYQDFLDWITLFGSKVDGKGKGKRGEGKEDDLCSSCLDILVGKWRRRGRTIKDLPFHLPHFPSF